MELAENPPMDALTTYRDELSRAGEFENVLDVVKRAARELTGADGATLVLRDGTYCYYAEENAISSLWKGRRFPMRACISGWVMQNKVPAVIEDIYLDTRIPHDAYRATFVKSLLMVPVNRTAPVAALGNYWAEKHRPTEKEMATLQEVADHLALALEQPKLRTGLLKKLNTD